MAGIPRIRKHAKVNFITVDAKEHGAEAERRILKALKMGVIRDLNIFNDGESYLYQFKADPGQRAFLMGYLEGVPIEVGISPKSKR